MTKYNNYNYIKGKLDFAQGLIEELYGQIEPSKDAWDRGYNAALRGVIRRIKKLISISYTLPDGDVVTIDGQERAKIVLGNFCSHCGKSITRKIKCSDIEDCMNLKRKIYNDWFGFVEEK